MERKACFEADGLKYGYGFDKPNLADVLLGKTWTTNRIKTPNYRT